MKLILKQDVNKIGKKGVVRDAGVHKEVINEITQFAMQTGFEVLGLDFSPIRGPEGNIEYLMYACKKSDFEARDFSEFIDNMVDTSHIEAR